MSTIELKAKKREARGSAAIGRLRRAGIVPAVVYCKEDPSVALEIASRDLRGVLQTEAGRNVLIQLRLEGEEDSRKPRTAVIKDLQVHPVTGEILHVDFHQISLAEKITVNVPLIEKGEAPGVKNEGGVLDVILRVLVVECLPTDIPEHIEVDISKLEMNQAVLVRDLAIPAALTVKNEADLTVVKVVPPKVEKPEEALAAAAGTEAKEPEVIGEKERKEREEAREKVQAEKAKEAAEAKSGKETPKKES